MNTLKLSLVATIAVGGVLLASAQQRPRVSPHETISAEIDGNKLKIAYGRPFSKNPRSGEIRKIWGGVVPYGKVWRTGANEATILETEQPLVFGDVTIPAGKYTLFTLPVEEGTSKLIINKRTGQWGVPYDEAKEATNELARIEMKRDKLDKTVDQFTMAIEKNASGGGVIKLMWENTQFTVPFTVKK